MAKHFKEPLTSGSWGGRTPPQVSVQICKGLGQCESQRVCTAACAESCLWGLCLVLSVLTAPACAPRPLLESGSALTASCSELLCVPCSGLGAVVMCA